MTRNWRPATVSRARSRQQRRAQSGGAFQPGILSILSQTLDNTASSLNLDVEIRYVLIPGGVSTDAAPVLAWGDYYAAVEHHSIEP